MFLYSSRSLMRFNMANFTGACEDAKAAVNLNGRLVSLG